MKEYGSVETLCVHAGVEPEVRTGAVMTPIFMTSTYAQPLPGKPPIYDYGRGGNPTRTALEDSLAALEGARHAISFASGLSAEHAIAQTLNPGDRAIVSEDAYGGTGRLFRRFFAKYGIDFAFVDTRDLAAVEAALTERTRLVWLETPTNPLLHITDVRAISSAAHKVGARVVVDNTFSSPILQQPLALGADVVCHSTTKYIGGHSDVIGGAVMTNDDELADAVRFSQYAVGAVNSPMDSFLLLRSIKTLALRMRRHSESGLVFARAMEKSGSFTHVYYPGLPSHPQHDLAASQMKAFSGIVTVSLPRDMQGVTRFLTSLKVFTLAESLGGVESLVNHPLTMTHASVPPDLRVKLGINEQLIRFSIGIEDVGDLVNDVQQALQA